PVALGDRLRHRISRVEGDDAVTVGGLNQLIRTLSDHTSIARPLVLTGPLQSEVRRLLQITGTDAILPLADTAHEGLQQLRAVDTSATRGQTPAAGI
ncbi:hypothetical protein ACWCRC_40980, partial [Streptomyces sp. NPDC001940]